MTDYPLRSVPHDAVTLEEGFWLPRLETNRSVTIPAVLDSCVRMGRVDDFLRAAGRLGGKAAGKNPWDDTDVYKAIEGACHSLRGHPDAALETRVEALVRIIADAQEPDGYLYTTRTIDPAHPHPWAGPERWSNLVMSHELYNCGHLYEAAAAHHNATGRRDLLDVALKSARLLAKVFGPDARHDIPGHQIVEMGLASLYRITGDVSHLRLAHFFLEERGRHQTRRPYAHDDNPGYSQDHMPVRDQRVAVGHAVRAVYMYTGMADVAVLMDVPSYRVALEAIWRDLVDTRIYLTGGLGARRNGEAFGDAYELPNDTAYNETCAAIGSVAWNHRMFLGSGDARYIDVLEHTLYNGLLSGVSGDGRSFFYPNPLASDGVTPFNYGSSTRQPWFECSCCPTNLCRFLPSLPGYLYAAARGELWVNLFAAGRAVVELAGVSCAIHQRTGYPWEGAVRLTLDPVSPVSACLRVRVPGWALDTVLGGRLYRYETPAVESPTLAVNGATTPIRLENGYAVIDRVWSRGDTVELRLPMPARKVLCDERVAANRGRAAIQRGPLVYCVEGVDTVPGMDGVHLGDVSVLATRWEPELLGGAVTVQGAGFRAVPYYTWANRGAGPMLTWLPNRQPSVG